ncbi:MAG TPA: hypothetical protein VGZ00_07030 [Candidatus Baltobacteraceae bacterium]|jgi:hypothetical protein|nr:hypothetical protein [Candidatus Baltobacteraceae bacterium]
MSKKDFPIEDVFKIGARYNLGDGPIFLDLPIVEHLLGEEKVKILRKESSEIVFDEFESLRLILQEQFPWLVEMEMPRSALDLSIGEYLQKCHDNIAAAKARHGEFLSIRGKDQERNMPRI